MTITDVSHHNDSLIMDALQAVMDPEYGNVSIVDLGIVDAIDSTAERLTVRLVPTMAGCPAREVIEQDVRAALTAVDGREIEVLWRLDGSWTPERLSRSACEQLGREFSVAIRHGEALPTCPLCSKDALREVAAVGPTRCRAVAWCSHCRNVIEIVG